ncbi:MAG TPA: P-type conjugative transfer protein TrbL [Thermoanaerobaculia bacterium]|nr:P-type conjugative transfer protein TrbL [Thermoanaerobaculia bacterium]
MRVSATPPGSPGARARLSTAPRQSPAAPRRSPAGLPPPPASPRRRRRTLAAATLLSLLALAPLLAPPLAAQPAAAADAVLDGVVQQYGQASGIWLERVLPLAQKTFAILATLELVVSGLFIALGREGLDAVAASLLKKFIVLCFFFTLLVEFPLWLPNVFAGFEAAGQNAAATFSLSPSGVLDLGIAIASNIMVAQQDIGFLTHPVGALVGTATALLVLLAYAFIAAQICLALVEVYLVLSGGVLFLGFAAFRVTAPFAEGYLLYSFQTGAKVYLLYLLVGVGGILSREWADLQFAQADSGIPPTLTAQFAVMTGALVLALLVWRTGAIAARLTSGASFNLREALR